MKSRSLMLFQPPDTHPCSYLPGQHSRSLYVDPREELDTDTLTLLSQNGFRRSGRLLYRPDCPGCSACQSVRLRCRDFLPDRSQKRVLKRNRRWQLSVQMPIYTPELYHLFERYIRERHADGDMFPPTPEQFQDFLCSDFGTTRFLLAHQEEQLVACMVFDVLQDGLSAVYCFYRPEAEQDSPGTCMILRLTQLALGLGLPYNYLGYYVAGSRKMDYKHRFRPLETWIDSRWQLLIR